MAGIFSVPVFFITFREALETAIIVSVFLALIDRMVTVETDLSLHGKLLRQIWFGTGFGFLTVIMLGTIVMTGISGLGADTLSGTEDIWEGTFSLAASVIITAMGAVLLRVSKLQDKWRTKLAIALDTTGITPAASGVGTSTSYSGLSLRQRVGYLSEKYALFVLPFITILREGFEAVIFMAGVGVGISAWALVLSSLAGLLSGAFVGLFIYKSANVAPIQYLLVASTCFLYLVGAGLFSKGVWHLEAYQWNMVVGGDAAELGSGPGSYDIRRSMWHVNCCNPDFEGGGFWGVFNALLGWQNSATVGSVVSYNLYWVAVITGFFVMAAKERQYWPYSGFEGKKAAVTSEVNGTHAEGEDNLQPLLGRREDRLASVQ
ncbi:plasma membrane iron permease [Ophiostoma piceae UAMH 11346]|uniref:Plasma membrane iron permease n=1 Tax=Ophiostoma piceae (strain UAMH 11346) TaxID=1262450 RepID=S3BRI4_OPHP1|nr:plasma membrane iron permease [Ophiostoma piceae UAMH 11346]